MSKNTVEVVTIMDAADDFTETIISVRYQGRTHMSIALSTEQLRELIPVLQGQLSMIEGDNQ